MSEGSWFLRRDEDPPMTFKEYADNHPEPKFGRTRTDKYGRAWPEEFVVCDDCGQPFTGSCQHGPLSPSDRARLWPT